MSCVLHNVKRFIYRDLETSFRIITIESTTDLRRRTGRLLLPRTEFWRRTLLDNIGDLSKPVTLLVEKISNAVGTWYEPSRIVKEARAEVEADRIKAIGRLDLFTELEQRGFERLIHQEGRKQANIEQITAQAAEMLPDNAKVEGLNEDWIAHFFKQCDTVSDKEMQSLWAKLLSGEATHPGTFSKRTVNFVSTIEKEDAELFTILCQFKWNIGNNRLIIYDYKNKLYKKLGIHFASIKHLESIGLISFEFQGYRRLGFKKFGEAWYYGQQIAIEFPEDKNNKLSLGRIMLTTIGQELAPICGSTRNQEYFEFILHQWLNSGLIISSVVPTKA